ncbi:MAG: ATP-binding protein [Actinobacteria bacterium]|nr:ATP-binding protein [Actinomycetota bacterium]
MAVLVGLQASGKTTFCHQMLGGYVQVSKDHWPSARNRQRRQLRLIGDALAAGRDVAVDNTNPSPEEWQPLMEVARQNGGRVVAYWFPPDLPGSLGRNAARQGRARVPEVGLRAVMARLQRPELTDGFDAVLTVRFDGAGGFHVIPAGLAIPDAR